MTGSASAATAVPVASGGLALRDIAVDFPRPDGSPLRVLDGIDLEVAAGEIVAVIGPNGCGKSTLLRVIAGLLTPAAGSLRLDGSPIAGPDSRIGLVFQEPRLLPWRTVARNVAYPLELAGWPSAARSDRVGELLARVGLAGSAEVVPSRLSGGMRQRAALARALALEPAVLVLDEPFSALDAMTRDRFNIELLDLWGRLQTTIVVVTHSIAEAIFLGDRVVVMNGGPGRIVGDMPIPLPRPRVLADLDDAAVSETSRRIRTLLGGGAA